MSGEMTVREAGRRGGAATRARHGAEHFRRIGALSTPSPAEQVRRARKGGATTKARHGEGFYERIGRLGGEAVRARYGIDYYRAIGARGGRGRGPAVGSSWRAGR